VDITPFVFSGIAFGFTAGISPGPLFALVVNETLQHNRRAGVRAALSPLCTDIPVVLLCLLLLSRTAQYNTYLGVVSIAGALFILYLSLQSIMFRPVSAALSQNPPASLRKGILVNFLSPHPYLFWLTIGTPILYKAYSVHVIAVAAFILFFYTLMVGTKIALAFLVDTSRTFMTSGVYIWIMRGLGGGLLIFAGIFLRDGILLILD